MRTEWQIIFLTQTVIMSCGCEKMESVVPSIMHQIPGSLQIQDKGQRDTALSDACRESARAGDVESILLGIPKLSSDKQRNELAHESVEVLAAVGRIEAATRTAALVTDPALRATLAAVP